MPMSTHARLDAHFCACMRVLTAHESSVSALGWLPASGCLATGAEDGIINLWDISGLEDGGGGGAELSAAGEVLLQTVRIEHCEVLCIAPSADGTAIFCGLDDGGFALLASKSR